VSSYEEYFRMKYVLYIVRRKILYIYYKILGNEEVEGTIFK
jgi:hypothetical protein